MSNNFMTALPSAQQKHFDILKAHFVNNIKSIYKVDSYRKRCNKCLRFNLYIKLSVSILFDTD